MAVAADIECPARGNQMAVFYPFRRACPACGRPLKAASDETVEGRLRYACTNCDGDPLPDPIARKWADGPLPPPEQ
ncbi:hypothetical protein BSZ22_31180 [Bradyrhizobium canariense]|uniref:Uncharacterized protein n=1 Tax=Bradyrhizobium canariense TaxID=255045 RepID=A0A1X3F0R5_9BRAD|nr:hypothetical protein BSZ21_38470 [Bradyrhizobium canariense]OSI65377.1 hypothetical protein BSZ22_31180 [Bradyrhizobium canariense]OSI75841.1 hypothetical protein BSZ23_27460 [Bradyrhizobium canariense]OSI87035.1 hypothetical protein BSZ25_28110 [Bradyrhizobium canariense]OSI99475.1 hypothetical protein BSZ16_29160 [Bradyrhizobium canariense]